MNRHYVLLRRKPLFGIIPRSPRRAIIYGERNSGRAAIVAERQFSLKDRKSAERIEVHSEWPPPTMTEKIPGALFWTATGVLAVGWMFGPKGGLALFVALIWSAICVILFCRK
jgi:hypothetical protein